ncbi:MAG: UbiA family prenyltransferase [Marmoricola sp.]
MGDKPETAEPGSTGSITPSPEQAAASTHAPPDDVPATKVDKRTRRKRARAEKKAARIAGKGSAKDARSDPRPKTARETTKDTPEQPPGPSEVREQLVGVLRATHPRQALLTAVVVAGAATVSGRPLREGLVAGAAVLAVQAILGLVNDVVDRERDVVAGVAGKPVAEGNLPPGNASFVATCLAILAIPLSLQNGSAAAVALLGTLLAGLVYDLRLRRTALSWLPWAVGYGLLPAFLSYGGWGGGVHGAPPTWAMTVLAALLGVGVHFLTSLPHLVADNKTGVRHLPLRIALKIGAPRLLVASGVFTGLVAVGLLVAAFAVGLRQ